MTSPLLLSSIGMVLLYCLGDVLYIPDGYELAIMSDCMDGTSFIDCSSIHMGFRPPLMSVLAWPFGWEGIPLLSILSLAVTAALLGTATKSYAVWIGILALFCTQNHPIISDARSLLPCFVFGGWLMIGKETITAKRAFWMSFLIGLGIWIRPEGLLGILLFVPFVLFFHPKHRYWIGLGTLIPCILWFLWLSYLAKTWTWSPRYWEGYMLASWDIMPKRLMMQLGGMGLYNTPMREIWMESAPIPTTTVLAFDSYMDWMKLVVARNWVLWTAGGISFVYLIYHRMRKGWALMGVLCINCIAALIPQARDPAFAESNFLLSHLALMSALSLGCAHLFSSRIFLSCLLPISVALINPSHDIERGLEHTPQGLSASAWIQKNSTKDSIWISSYENAPIIWLAQRNWKQWEDPWHPVSEPHYRITTQLDVFDMGQELCLNQKLEAFFEDAHRTQPAWVAIYSCRP